MKDKIKEILKGLKEHRFLGDSEDLILLDYITNLQEENEKYKKMFEAKERFSKIMPEDTDFIILSKADYDRQQENIELTTLELKTRNEKAVDYINENKHLSMFADCREPEEDWNYDLEIDPRDLLNILQGKSDE